MLHAVSGLHSTAVSRTPQVRLRIALPHAHARSYHLRVLCAGRGFWDKTNYFLHDVRYLPDVPGPRRLSSFPHTYHTPLPAPRFGSGRAGCLQTGLFKHSLHLPVLDGRAMPVWIAWQF